MKTRLKGKGEGISESEIAEAYEDRRADLDSLHDVDSSLIHSSDQAALNYFNKRNVPPIGSVPIPRQSGTWRWICANVNGLATTRSRNDKVQKTHDLLSKYDANGLAFCEVGLDCRALRAHETLPSLLQLKCISKSTLASNRRDPVMGKAKQGGCAVVALGEICQYVKITKGGNDHRDLGRWASIILQAHQGQRTRIVSAYNVGTPKPKWLGTVYQQHLRCIQTDNLEASPRELMRRDFIAQLQEWLRQGDRIFIYMDANENVISGKLCSQLADLGFTPWAHRIHGSIPNTHPEGSECIDEFWGSYGLEVTNIQLLPYFSSSGDHRTVIVDFTTRSTIGVFAHRIVRADCRRLILKNKPALTKYIELVERQWVRNWINERLTRLLQLQSSYPVDDELKRQMEILDKQIREIQAYGEAHCRLIRKIDGEYSLPGKYWHEKMVAIKGLIRRLEHKTRNDGNICRAARRHNIAHPRSHNLEELRAMYRIALARKRTLKPQAGFLRDQHLRMLEARAVAAEDTTRATEIRNKRLAERSKKSWSKINWVVRPPHPGALMRVEREIDGQTVEFTEEEPLIENILDVIQDRFSGAEDANISNCSITDDLGDYGFTELGLKIISGQFTSPDDMDTATTRLLQTIGEIGKLHKDDDINIDVTPSEFISGWQ